MSVHKHTKM